MNKPNYWFKLLVTLLFRVKLLLTT